MKNSPSPISRRRLTAAVLAGATLAFAPLSPAETVETIQKTLAASPGGLLRVDVAGARIDVSGAPGSEVVIDIVRKVSASSKEDEEAYLRNREVTIDQAGNTVSIRQKRAGGGWSWLRGWMGGGTKADFRYTVTVPRPFNVDLDTSGGSISVRELEGEVRADTSGGGITCANVKGRIDADTSGGSITLTGCHGATRADTSGGSITAEDGSGAANLDTSGGSIRVRNHRGDVYADTSGGSIVLDGISGNVRGSTSGGSIRATLLAPPTGENRLSTSGGGISVNLPLGAGVELDAETSGGRVRCDLDIAGRDDKKSTNRLRGPVNGGGPLLRLRTSGGGINVTGSGVES